MTTDKYNIDKIFKDSFSNMQQTPPAYLWGSIKGSMNMAARAKKRMLIWYAAASIAIITAFGSGFLLSGGFSTQPVVNNQSYLDTEPKSQNAQQEAITPIIRNTDREEESASIPDNKSEMTNPERTMASPRVKKQLTGLKRKVQKVINTRLGVEKVQRPIAMSYNVLPFELVVDRSSGNFQKHNLQVGGLISPQIAYRSLSGQNSKLIESYNNLTLYRGVDMEPKSNESPILAYSGGINLSYAPGKRISIQTGINYSQIGQKNNEIYVNQSMNSAGTSEISIINSSAGQITADENSTMFLNSLVNQNSNVVGMDKAGDILYGSQANLIQRFEYIELPVILGYKLIDREIDLNLMAGISTSVLVGNTALIEMNVERQKVGVTEGIRKINYNGSLGFGLSYDINRRVQLNLQPLFRYSLQAIDQINNIAHPYSFGLFSGCSYQF